MTPLALDLAEHLYGSKTLYIVENPPPYRMPTPGDLRSALSSSRFFDLAACSALMLEISDKMRKAFDEHDHFSDRLAFLPAAQTWVEYIARDGVREVILLVGSCDSSLSAASLSLLQQRCDGAFCMLKDMHRLPLVHSGGRPSRHLWALRGDGKLHQREPGGDELTFDAYADLALINSPRVIGQRQHMPHERIEREKLKQRRLVGKFPVQAWTEIMLTVAPPDARSGEPASEGHLTGDKCLHFCRTHLRVRRGRLEYVEGHWRGDPALGIKQSRYRVVN
ncbi:hypothetical protein [Bradyrhizobium liaoningense]|uniref:hypothetical protein n=1 Tax=Bradyrhizobium liaoningense TaxID=43992 RepID=UPI001BA566B1|nr:hypothetical protein [Bradyrhizobium liaoningense]MBR0941022.1 hypothetical protein [Bradyrhizobium liaoningense]